MMIRYTRALLAVLLLSLLAGACESPTATPAPTSTPEPTETPAPTRTPTPGPIFDIELARAELNAAMELWRTKGSDNYDLESLVLCLCHESNRPLRLTVRNGVIESVTDWESGEALTEDDYVDDYTYKTVSDRFRQIAGALSKPVYGLNVEYHPSLGYPTYLGINYANVVDDGFSLKRLVYEAIDPNAEPTPTAIPTPTREPVYDVEQAKVELAAARALWESNGSDDYTIEYHTRLLGRFAPVRVTVREGVIESATFLEGRDAGSPVSPEDMHAVETIDGLFDRLEEALSDPPAFNMGAEYDAEFGYPTIAGVYTSSGVTSEDDFGTRVCCYEPFDDSTDKEGP